MPYVPEHFSENERAALHKLAASASELLEMHRNYQNAGWLGRILWKATVIAGAVIAAVATFKEHLLSFFVRT